VTWSYEHSGSIFAFSVEDFMLILAFCTACWVDFIYGPSFFIVAYSFLLVFVKEDFTVVVDRPLFLGPVPARISF
jgi:hypothetical protein